MYIILKIKCVTQITFTRYFNTIKYKILSGAFSYATSPMYHHIKNTAIVGINITAKRGRIIRACISIRFSPITRVNIAVSYIIYIYYNKEKEALKVWENI